MKRFARSVLFSTPLWLTLGAANALVGVAIALRADGSRDVGWLWIWTRNWLQGTNPYALPVRADYAPWAIVALSPIGLVSAAVLPLVWACAGVGLALAVVWLGPKAMAVQSPPFGLSVGIFLAWAAVRYGLGNGQFALWATACGLAAMWLARRDSMWSGVLLGAAMVKPHVAVAFLAWAVVARQWRSICIAAATIGTAWILFSVRLHQSAVSTMAQYVRQVGGEFLGPHPLRGGVEFRPLVEAVIGAPGAAAVVDVSLIAAAFAAILWSLSRQPSELRAQIALPLFCTWTLASAFHNAYDLVLLWPVWLVLWERHARASDGSPYLLAFVQVALVAGVPGIWWKLRGPAWDAGSHFDRVLVAGLLIYLLVTALRRPSVRQVHGRELVQATTRHPSEVMLP